MSGRFVRASKYRHVFGRSTKKEQCYDNLRISKNAWDTNLIKANPQYISVNWEASGGGAFAVIPINERGRLPEQIPLFRGHTAAVLDTDWSPFDDSLIASGSDDGKVFIWRVPDGFTLYTDAEEPSDVAPVARLTGHSRKVGHVLFNPAAENVLASSSGDYTIKLWDVEAGASKLQLRHADIVQSLSWNATGTQLVTTCRDKKLRVWDVRQEKPAHEVPGHSGAKNSRAVWMGEHDKIATTGFSRMSDRQLGLWDARSPKEPIGGFTILDQISGVCMPFWDDGTQMLYLAGKGDGNIRYYEFSHDKFEYLSEYKSADPQRGIAFLPKRGVNVHDNEVMRCFKTVNDTFIEPISFIVPRRAEVFQEDIYPPTTGTTPAVSAAEWFDGKDGYPPKISLESVYEGGAASEPEPEQVKPAAAPVPSPAPAQAPASRGPPPSMKDNKASLSSMASKFADEDEVSSDSETSSFEEIPKPVERPLASRMEQKTRGPEISKAPIADTQKDGREDNGPLNLHRAPAIRYARPLSPSPPASTQPTPSLSHAPTSSISSTTNGSATTTPRSASGAAAGAAAGLKDYLQDIKNMLEAQNKTMSGQSEQIAQLTAEVGVLKSQLRDSRGGGSEKDERIRQLELELEEARS
ncbi:Coronin-like protein crn1 [Coniosporium tulheliwenetii]|uniref:Coronin-like protein crn1 n=1 Tax=Coniosporium tulheliwenetii TaxID=3383036 RepID=A0ACC2YVQ4_9PEZI|nr:Coronin-like protein crn1 [Cladosporium sp. JES 115]